MDNKINILQNYDKIKYSNYPFPHFEIENALPQNIYNKLKKEYSIFQKFFEYHPNYKKNNARIQVSAEQIFSDKIYFEKSIWYEFAKYHTSREFFIQIFDIFKNDINKIYPEVYKKFNDTNNKKNFINVRSNNNNLEYEFVADCQPGINTPVQHLSSVRGPHIDNPVELIGGLFYLRDENDTSKGGDLEIYDSRKKNFFEGKAEVSNIKDLKLVKTFKYRKNHCVFFLNSLKSIHAISPRENTRHNRYLTNIIIERYKESNSFFKIPKTNILKKFFS